MSMYLVSEEGAKGLRALANTCEHLRTNELRNGERDDLKNGMGKMMMNAKAMRKAHREAKVARKRAHAPYSGFKVGAALVTAKGRVYCGCNVENASYGGTVCAERVAILKAVSEGESDFHGILVVTDADRPAFPCALCLQTMAEFFRPQARIAIADLKGVVSEHRFDELLPKSFGPRQLKKARGGS